MWRLKVFLENTFKNLFYLKNKKGAEEGAGITRRGE